MKSIVRDCLMWFVSMIGIARLYQWRMRTKGPLVRVLCFHDVPDRAWFLSLVAMMQRDFHIITPQEFHQKRFHPQKINLLLTFDDGYQSWIDIVLPVFEQYHVKGIFFISSGLLDAAEEGGEVANAFVQSNLRLKQPRRLLTWVGARALVVAGQTIGGHTVHHYSLATCLPADVQSEIVLDKQALETNLQTAVNDFAFPFGNPQDISITTTRQIKSHGYQCAYTAQPGFSVDQELTPRTLIDASVRVGHIRRWIEGAYDIVRYLV